MGERPSEYDRADNDWYVEPVWCVEALKSRLDLPGAHDPCCGRGTIPKALGGTGSDIVDRGYGYPVRNFLLDEGSYENIVTNPPYNIAQRVIEHARNLAENRVCALVQLKFLASQGRHNLMREAEQVLIFSRRPSMPPGKLLEEKGENIRGNGSLDFCWVIWKRGHIGPSTIDWIK